MKNWQDPNAAVEAANYNNPIPSRVLILQTLIEHGGATQHELAVIFDLNDSEYEALGNRLKAMVRDGQLSRDADGGNPYIYRPLTEKDAVTGVVAAQ